MCCDVAFCYGDCAWTENPGSSVVDLDDRLVTPTDLYGPNNGTAGEILAGHGLLQVHAIL